jgi:hypothetical protein
VIHGKWFFANTFEIVIELIGCQGIGYRELGFDVAYPFREEANRDTADSLLFYHEISNGTWSFFTFFWWLIYEETLMLR